MSERKSVLVTGAAKGIGRAVALRFAEAGYDIFINYHSTEPAELVEQIKAVGVDCQTSVGDVSDFNYAKDLVKACMDAYGKIDVLINNAGITRDNILLGLKEEDFDLVIATNLKGTFNMVKHASKFMLKAKSGAIINVSSVVGIVGNAGQTNYAASKAGVIGLTKSAAKELASRGITVNAIAPGFIETDMTGVLTDDQKNVILADIPLKRAGKPEEVASAALFFAENPYITGQVLCVDGGMV
ncbi:MAG: 3-oxoacyl-[acyl-carrier-protein] reductase [Lachnospiraceae bacterium]|jgi:3-oxoacyl-[acyl-carrier protein] reductase|nr:3-oxoacyl-[acyl-carrier-protein] reductase [Lachnospiraceae bacterium]MEE3460972.1 3-oxoacyl-[acyl-carrier-protein] reductase [Lachnospiraceae bacterium]